MIVRRPRWLQGLYRRHFFALEAIFLALLAVTSISSCPRKCQCIWRDSKITVDCSDQELAAIPTTVEANTQVSNNIYAMSLLTAWMVNNVHTVHCSVATDRSSVLPFCLNRTKRVNQSAVSQTKTKQNRT